MHVLLVEDDARLADSIRDGLRDSGFAVDRAADAESAWRAFDAGEFDLLVLDLGLPDTWGLKLLRRLRRRGNDVPTLILSAYSELDHRVEGLDSGADDYLVKPFSLAELEARLRALHRRRSGHCDAVLCCGGLRLDPSSLSVSVDGDEKHLPRREFAILQTLLEHAGQVVTRSRLEHSIYALDDELGSNAMEVHVHHLRRKLGRDLIRTIRGVGYMIGDCDSDGGAPTAH
jgi:DNA-binding response OmpR family regulator